LPKNGKTCHERVLCVLSAISYHLSNQHFHARPPIIIFKRTFMTTTFPKVGIVMGSKSDLTIMQEAAKLLAEFKIPFEIRILSAHRAPDLTLEYAQTAASRGLEIIIAGAGSAAALPGMIAAKTWIPVIGVPLTATSLGGLDALLSIVQMPGGVPVATVAIGAAGARNAALLATRILALRDEKIKNALLVWIANLQEEVVNNSFVDLF
jgi:5-(carboxyamino)imidazole ribonucleotide mutase